MKKEIKFYIPFSVDTFQFNVNLVEMIENFPYAFYDNYVIGAFYGCLGGSIWNGGSRHSLQQISSIQMAEIEQFTRNHNIPLRLTFTNRLLEQKHLYDTYSNVMLEVCKLGNNEVLVASDIMEKYIKENWKEYKIIKSTCWSENVPYDDTDRFYMSVLNRKKNMDDNFLINIRNKNKIEIVLNEYCHQGCPHTFKHYDQSSLESLNYTPISYFCLEHYPEKNASIDKNVFLKKDRRENNNEYVNKERLEKILIPMGFTNFKIVGRSYSILSLIIDTVYYMVKPEYHDDMVIALANKVLGDTIVL